MVIVHHWGTKEGPRKQELMQKPWRNGAYWLASSRLISHLSYIAQANLHRDGTTHSGLRCSTIISNQEIIAQICPWTNRMKSIPQVSFLSPCVSHQQQ